MDREDLGAAIAATRIEAGLTQEQLGDLTGLGQTVVSRIESGQRRIESIELLSIARALGVDLGELLAAAEARGAAPDSSMTSSCLPCACATAAQQRWMPWAG